MERLRDTWTRIKAILYMICHIRKVARAAAMAQIAEEDYGLSPMQVRKLIDGALRTFPKIQGDEECVRPRGLTTSK